MKENFDKLSEYDIVNMLKETVDSSDEFSWELLFNKNKKKSLKFFHIKYLDKEIIDKYFLTEESCSIINLNDEEFKKYKIKERVRKFWIKYLKNRPNILDRYKKYLEDLRKNLTNNNGISSRVSKKISSLNSESDGIIETFITTGDFL